MKVGKVIMVLITSIVLIGIGGQSASGQTEPILFGLTSGEDSRLCIVDPSTGTVTYVAKEPINPFGGHCNGLDWNPDTGFLYATCESMYFTSGHAHLLQFTLEGKQNNNNVIDLRDWNGARHTFDSISDISFSPNGSFFAYLVSTSKLAVGSFYSDMMMLSPVEGYKECPWCPGTGIAVLNNPSAGEYTSAPVFYLEQDMANKTYFYLKKNWSMPEEIAYFNFGLSGDLRINSMDFKPDEPSKLYVMLRTEDNIDHLAVINTADSPVSVKCIETSKQLNAIAWVPHQKIGRDEVDFYPTGKQYLITSEKNIKDFGLSSEFKGVFVFYARFANNSGYSLEDLAVRVESIKDGDLLMRHQLNKLPNEWSPPAGVGAIWILPRQFSKYRDGILSPGESADFAFAIGLKKIEPFSFFVDLMGVVSP